MASQIYFKMGLCKRDQVLIDGLIIGEKSEIITNPFSKESCELEPQAVALYDYIVGSEVLGLTAKLRTSLSLFRRLYPSQYSVLLD